MRVCAGRAGANAMAISLARGRRVTLSKVDAFADGVAVKQVCCLLNCQSTGIACDWIMVCLSRTAVRAMPIGLFDPSKMLSVFFHEQLQLTRLTGASQAPGRTNQGTIAGACWVCCLHRVRHAPARPGGRGDAPAVPGAAGRRGADVCRR